MDRETWCSAGQDVTLSGQVKIPPNLCMIAHPSSSLSLASPSTLRPHGTARDGTHACTSASSTVTSQPARRKSEILLIGTK